MTHVLRLEVLSTPEAIWERRSVWDACVTASRGDIYFTADWVVSWWKTYGKRLGLTAFVLWDDATGQVVAVLAFAIDAVMRPVRSLRLARLAGIDPNFAIMGLPILPDHAPQVWHMVLDHLFIAERCTFVSVSPVSDEGDQRLPLLTAVEGTQMQMVRNRTDRDHTLFDLPATGGLYSGLSKGRQREYRRSRNQMDRSYVVALTQSSPESLEQDLESFIDLHTRQWEALGKGGHFSDWPGSVEFLNSVMPALSGRGQAMVEHLTGDGEILVSRLTFQLGDRVYWRLTARTLDPKAQSMGVARVALLDWAEAAALRGGRIIEAGAGTYDHKLSYGGRNVPLRSLVIATDGTRRKAVMALAMFDLVHLLYYRIWFLRLAPRVRGWFGLRPGPLWRFWIKTRM